MLPCQGFFRTLGWKCLFVCFYFVSDFYPIPLAQSPQNLDRVLLFIFWYISLHCLSVSFLWKESPFKHNFPISHLLSWHTDRFMDSFSSWRPLFHIDLRVSHPFIPLFPVFLCSSFKLYIIVIISEHFWPLCAGIQLLTHFIFLPSKIWSVTSEIYIFDIISWCLIWV